jgi:hypothetical protein
MMPQKKIPYLSHEARPREACGVGYREWLQVCAIFDNSYLDFALSDFIIPPQFPHPPLLTQLPTAQSSANTLSGKAVSQSTAKWSITFAPHPRCCCLFKIFRPIGQ